MPTGTIKKLVQDRGFGFIAAEDGKEYFFHRTGLDSSVSFDSLAGGEGAGFIDGWHEGPCEGEQTAGHLHLAFLTDDDWEPAGVCLTQDASGRVHGTVYGGAPVDSVKRQAARILSLDVDGRAWPDVARRDPVVARLQKMFPGFRPVNWSNAYEATAWCLISSRITMRQGQGIKEKMSRELGATIDIHGHRLYCFPGPDALIQLRSFRGLFGRKVEYLNGLGRAALGGRP